MIGPNKFHGILNEEGMKTTFHIWQPTGSTLFLERNGGYASTENAAAFAYIKVVEGLGTI